MAFDASKQHSFLSDVPELSKMDNRSISTSTSSTLFKLPLRWVLIVPFVLQISAAVGITGFLSIRNGQRAVNELSSKLMESTTQAVEQHLNRYLSTPVKINQTTTNLIRQGIIQASDTETLGLYFWQQAMVYSSISYIGFTSNTGSYIGAGEWLDGYDVVIDEANALGKARTYDTTREGVRGDLVYEYEYFAMEEDWYGRAVESNRPIWTLTVEDVEPLYVAAGVTQPVYDRNNQLLGVVGTDLVLSDISNVLTEIVPAEGGRLFIVEPDGTLVANSEVDAVLNLAGDRIERANSADSIDELTNAAGQHLQPFLGNLSRLQSRYVDRFTFQNQAYFIQVEPWQDTFGLNWLLIAVVPETAFTAQIQANTRTTAYLCLIALLTTLCLGLVTSRWIDQPISKLSQASQTIAHAARGQTIRQLDPQLTNSRIQELQALAMSFSQMAQQLQSSFAQLESSNADLERRVDARTADLSDALSTLQKTQMQLVQTEKMSSLGQLVAGVAHEINNPITFIKGNLAPLEDYTQNLLELVHQLEDAHPDLAQIIKEKSKAADLDFIRDDLPKILKSIEIGTERIRQIVTSLKNFSRLDQAKVKEVDIHEGIESTLLILQSRLRANPKRSEIKIIRQYSDLPLVECFAGQLNQVFMNILANAVDALDEAIADPTWTSTPRSPEITIQTINGAGQTIKIVIHDNGMGVPDEAKDHLFEPFFTTKDIGKGTGMGLSISYQIITDTHQGRLSYDPSPEQGSQFIIEIPIEQHGKENR